MSDGPYRLCIAEQLETVEISAVQILPKAYHTRRLR
jgi:hypothetical protein